MYCKNCNAENADGSRFCSNCGADMLAQQRADEDPQHAGSYTQQPPQQPPQQPYQQPYQQPPYYGAQPQGEMTRPLSGALPIISLILGIVFVNLIGILLGAFSLSNFNRYTAALNARDFVGAEEFKKKSRRLATVGIVLCVVFFVLAVLAAIALGVFFFVSETGGGEPLVQFNYGDFTTSPFDMPAMLQALI